MVIENSKLKAAVGLLIESFRTQLYTVHKTIVFNKTDFNQALKGQDLMRKYKYFKDFQTFEKIARDRFNKVLDKGEAQNIEWTEISFDKFVSDNSSDQLDEIHGHLGLKHVDRCFSIIGLHFILINGSYKLNSMELCGLYEIELLEYSYVHSDDMQLEQLEDDGF